MTKIDFYLTADNSFSASTDFAIKLINKVYQKGFDIELCAATDVLSLLDQQLWQSVAFIPHQVTNHRLVISKLLATQASKVLINLCNDKPHDIKPYARVLQILPNHPDILANGRDLYRHYQQLGLSIKTHQLAS